jgi:hypothetical protein
MTCSDDLCASLFYHEVSGVLTPQQTKIRAFMRGNFFIPPKKTSGLRSARPKKKPPIWATKSQKVPFWWLSTRKLEPILTDDDRSEHLQAQPRRLGSGQARC